MPSTVGSSTRAVIDPNQSAAIHAKRATAIEPGQPHKIIDRAIVVHFTPGNGSVMRTAPTVLATAPDPIEGILADKGYDAVLLRADLLKDSIAPLIFGTHSRKRPFCRNKRRYKDRWRLVSMFCRFKDSHRVAIRDNKLAHDYASAVALATTVEL